MAGLGRSSHDRDDETIWSVFDPCTCGPFSSSGPVLVCLSNLEDGWPRPSTSDSVATRLMDPCRHGKIFVYSPGVFDCSVRMAVCTKAPFWRSSSVRLSAACSGTPCWAAMAISTVRQIML